MEAFKLLFFVLGCAQACRLSVTTSEERGVITPSCNMDCNATPAGFSSTQMKAGFRAYYKEEGLTDKGLMVCMKVGDSGALDQCMVSALADDPSLESAGDCVEATQTAVPDAYQKVGDKWMMASADKQNYAAGKQFCADNGGVMARVSSAAENAAIAEFMKSDNNDQHVYIGVNDIDVEDDFKFNDATSDDAGDVSYTNWNLNEPNNHWNEDCVVMRANKEFRWNDVSCSKSFRILCEYMPQA